MSDTTTASISPAEASLMRVESARYALLRRLSFAMRHNLVMHLQPIGMVTEVMERRLRAASPDLAQVHDGMGKINNFSKAAVQACLDVITWLAPEPGATLPLQQGVQDCMALLRSNFSFRGFNVRSEVESAPQPVGKSAVRMLLSGVLVVLSDDTPAPADMTLRASGDGDVVRLEVRVQRTQGDAGPMGELPYRPMKWAEVEALARAEDVELERSDAGAVLTFNVLE
ncbi:MAG: hypothetical protein ACJ8GO_13865 [Ramlibacter sp.]